MIITDTRANPFALPWLVVGTDTFLSGWGGAKDGKSVAAWACASEEIADHVAEHIRARDDMSRVRIVLDRRYKTDRPYRPRAAHYHVYACEAGHRYHPESGGG